MNRALPHIFARTFNCPLAVHPARLDALVAGLRVAAFHRGAALEGPTTTDIKPRAELQQPPGRIAILPIRDVLVNRSGQIDADSTELESYSRIGARVAALTADPSIAGIILDIDSCGGESGGVFDLCADIRTAAATKPIWAIANEDCFSAAYAIAASTSRIWTTRTAGLGSIGVVALHTDQSGFDAAMGIKYEYITAGARKVDGNPHEPLTDAARTSVQAEIDRIFGIFVEHVSAGRGLDAETIAGTEAGVFYGENAVQLGLADDVGTLSDAVRAMAAILEEPAMTTAKPAATTAAVVQLDQVRQAGANVRRDAAEILNLCAVAGLPQLAADFIGKGTPIAAVSAELQRRRAEADAAQHIEIIDTSRVAATAANAQQAEMNRIFNSRFAAHAGRKEA